MINYKAILVSFFTLLLTITSYAQTTKSVDDLIKELKIELNTAVTSENYEKAEKIKNEIKGLEANKAKINQLQKEKEEAVAIEDYDRAIEIEKEIALLKKNETPKPKPAVVAPKVVEESAPEILPPSILPPSGGGSYSGEFNFFKRGFYLDGMLGIMMGPSTEPGVGFRIGNKWYFGKDDGFRSGFQVRWVKIGLFPLNDFVAHFAPLNIGYAGIAKLSESNALEINFTVGFNIIQGLNYEYTYYRQGAAVWNNFTGQYEYQQILTEDEITPTYMGFMINPSVKYRFRKFAVGLDYSISIMAGGEQEVRINGSYTNKKYPGIIVSILSVTLGFKF